MEAPSERPTALRRHAVTGATVSTTEQPSAASISAYLHTEAVILDRERCLKHLAEESFGRVVVSTPRHPLIRPVNYCFDQGSQSVVFRTASGTKLAALRNAEVASFEIDHVDPATGTGWSVIMEGVIEEVAREYDVVRLAKLRLDPLEPGEKPNWVRIRAFTVSGRMIA